MESLVHRSIVHLFATDHVGPSRNRRTIKDRIDTVYGKNGYTLAGNSSETSSPSLVSRVKWTRKKDRPDETPKTLISSSAHQLISAHLNCHHQKSSRPIS
jgi:hypothetical protein